MTENKKHLNQAAILYAFTLLGVVLGFAVSIVNTRFLSVDDYGILKFVQQLFEFLAVLVSFGFSYSIGRMVVHEDEHDDENKTHRKIIGVGILINLGIAIISGLFIFFVVFFSEDLVEARAKEYLLLFMPFAFVFIFDLYLKKLFQGSNRIYSLAFFSVLPRFVYLVLAGVLILTSYFNLFSSMVVFYFLSTTLIIAYCYSYKPIFKNLDKAYTLVRDENKVNGFPIYVGTLANVATAQSLGVLVGIYVDMEAVAYFSLAIVVSSPLQMLPSVIGTTLFKSFAKQDQIPLKVLLASIGLSVLSLIAFWLVIDFVLVLAYSERYLQVSPYAKILAVGMICHGLGDLYNRFIGAHGMGKMLRNGAFISGAVLVLSCIILMPLYDAMGAIWAKTLSSIAYLGAMLYYYKKCIQSRQ